MEVVDRSVGVFFSKRIARVFLDVNRICLTIPFSPSSFLTRCELD